MKTTDERLARLEQILESEDRRHVREAAAYRTEIEALEAEVERLTVRIAELEQQIDKLCEHRPDTCPCCAEVERLREELHDVRISLAMATGSKGPDKEPTDAE